ncbi:uncharacterized protein O3C94_016680 [Discoglossus pictus]
MPRSKEIPEEIRKNVVDLYDSGKGYKAISKALGLHLSTVRTIITKWRTFGIIENLPRSGQPAKTSPGVRHEIIQDITKKSAKCDIYEHKYMIDENGQTLRTMGTSGNRSSGLHGENLSPELINEEGEYEREETEVEGNTDHRADGFLNRNPHGQNHESCDVNVQHNNGTSSEIINRAEGFVCTDCGKCFSYRSYLINHQKIHSSEKPFACSECGKCFAQKSQLFTHQRIHSGEKPFECSECGKCFTAQSNFVRHKKTHTGEKPFTCSECGKCYTQKTNLVKHQRVHTEPCNGNLRIVEIKEESEETDIQEIHPYPGEGPSTNTEQVDDLIITTQQQVKEEEVPVNINNGLKDYSLHIVTIKEEREDNDTQQMVIHSDPCAGIHTELIEATHKEGEEKRDEKYIQKIEIHSDPCSSRSVSGNTCNAIHGDKAPKEEGCRSEDQLTNHLSSREELNIIVPHSIDTTCKETTLICMNNNDYLGYNKNNENTVSYNGKLFQCGECDKCFSTNYYRVLHQRTHTVGKQFSCSECGKSFSMNSNLLRHKLIHTGVKPFKCSECSKCFGTKSRLERHQIVHTGEKPFECSECGKCYSSKGNLLAHQTTHTGTKPYVCSDCGKSFRMKSHLVRHQRIHTGEKPYSCNECGKSFSVNAHLVTHQFIHTGDKPFECTECGKHFSTKSHLLRHQLIHTREKSC